VGTLRIAGGGLTFLLLPFQYLVGWEEINLAISMNLFRLVHFESWPACRSAYGTQAGHAAA
jgi:hypothetical protein